MADIKIRFNKKHTGDHDLWRVFEGEREHNVALVIVEVPRLWSSETFEDGERKFNLECCGTVRIEEFGDGRRVARVG